MDSQHDRAEPGTTVILKSLPPGLLDGLPPSDKRAIAAIVGKPVLLVEYDEVGRAELEFLDETGDIHYIYVNPEFIRCADPGRDPIA